jgi:2-polyprenyl-6-methoxyphenol hydroxylase-like FAD-dependent oxidoreductase
MRELIGVRFIGAPYKDTFIMGDFGDNSGWKDEARIFVTPRGSVESFPLPGEKRRYVLRTPYYIKENTTDYLEREIPKRCGVEAGKVRKYWESSFGVQHYLAERFYKNRVFLCGDAAHLMPPIGGQNMNVGFADAELAVWAAFQMIRDERNIKKTALFYSTIRRKSAKSAASRAGILMKAGTSGGFVWSFIRSVIGFIIMHSIFKNFALSVAGMINLPYRNMASYR